MPLFLALLIQSISRVVAGYGALFTGRVVAAITAISLYTSLTVGLAVGAATAIATALEAAPDPIVTGASWIIPARFPQLVGLWLSVQATAIAYRVALKAASYNPFRGVGG